MVAAIRTSDFRQIMSVALATDRHDLAKLALLLGPKVGTARPADPVEDALTPDRTVREALRRRFD